MAGTGLVDIYDIKVIVIDQKLIVGLIYEGKNVS